MTRNLTQITLIPYHYLHQGHPVVSFKLKMFYFASKQIHISRFENQNESKKNNVNKIILYKIVIAT